MKSDDFDFDDEKPNRSSARDGYAYSVEASGLGDFLAFRRMIVPIIIQFVFWIGVIALFVGALYLIVETDSNKARGAYFIAFLSSVVGWRIFCEMVIIFFRMNETMTLMYNELRRLNRKMGK